MEIEARAQYTAEHRCRGLPPPSPPLPTAAATANVAATAPRFARRTPRIYGQVALVSDFLKEAKAGASAVKQMIMGAGKTTVVSPLLCLFLADTTRLVCLVVPGSLFGFTRSILASVFSTIVQKEVVALQCDRSTELELRLPQKLARAKARGHVVIAKPQDVKAMMLRLVENLIICGEPRNRKNDAALRAETLAVGRCVGHLRGGRLHDRRGRPHPLLFFGKHDSEVPGHTTMAELAQYTRGHGKYVK